MSRIVELQKELQDATMAVAHAERTLAAHPGTPSVLATLRTIQKRQQNLAAEFVAVADELGLDVCSYRIELPNEARATVSSLTAVLSAFQKTFTSVYDALLNGPKKTTKTSDDVQNATAFGFAYTFPGSIGVMMTLPNERMLVDETALSNAMKATFELMSAGNATQVQALTERLGIAAVRQAHQWATENAKAHFGADILWQRDRKVLQEIRVQPQQLSMLARTIFATSAREETVVTGTLFGVSIPDRTFRMEIQGGKVVSGTFDTAISSTKPVEIPRLYKATLQVRQRVVPAIEQQEEITYFLVRLDPPGGPDTLLSDLSSR